MVDSVPREAVTQPEAATPEQPAALPASPAVNNSAAPQPLFAAPGIPNGRPLTRFNGGFQRISNSASSPGRAAVVDRASFATLVKLTAGETVTLPLLDGRVFQGKVNAVTREPSLWVRVGGELSNGDGSFFFGSDGSKVLGMVLLKRERIAYEFEEQKDGKLWLLEKSLGDVVCDPLPPEPGPARAPLEGAAEAVPLLESRPGAKEVLYLDFDGATVTDPSWDSGRTIVAPSFNLSAATISAVFDSVKEDWYAFNLNVTTDATRYSAAAVGHRMRVIVTSNDAAAPGAGGVAYLTSFRNAGSSFSVDIPCWVFNSSTVGIAEAISHEVGHTMGLRHDGRELSSGHEEYYQGQGSGATGWCPIMGAGYYKKLVQWSKGEYGSANNQEDDLAIISATYNHFGYTVDDAGNTRASAAALSGNASSGVINQAGVIERTGDIDFYTFFTNGGNVVIDVADPSSSPDLDLVLELQDASGNVVKTDNPLAALNASVSATLTQGQYYVKVSPTGLGNPLTTGFTNYGSLGQYLITGTVSGLTQNPIVTSSATASGQVGVSFGYRIKATGNPASYGVTGTLPQGLSVDSTSGYIVGYPAESGVFPVTVSATNASGTGTRSVTITISDAALTLGEALDFTTLTWTTTAGAPWIGQKAVVTDNEDAAQAAVIGDGEESSFSTSVTGPVTLEFKWKVASEENGDFLALKVDGVDVTAISGVIDWTLVSIPISSGSHLLTWTYRKNAAISQDPDTAWVDAVKFLSVDPPVINSAADATGTVGSAFSYQITATNTPSSFSLASGPLPLGVTLNGKTGEISGVPAAASSTSVLITASNNVGASAGFSLSIEIAASSVTLAQAADDFSAGTYTVSANPTNSAKWFPQTVTTHDGVDALQSGPIGANESTSLAKTVSGINTINFWWKIESKPTGNRARFVVDGTNRINPPLSGVADWENVSIYVGPGTHNVSWIYERDASGTLGADAVWIDQVTFTTALLPMVNSADTATGTQGSFFTYQIAGTNSPTFYSAIGLPDGLTVDSASGVVSGIPNVAGIFDVIIGAGNPAGTGTKTIRVALAAPPITLPQALDAPQLTWSTDPSSPWAPQTAVTYDGLHAARSGAIPHSGKSSLETHVVGPTTIKFRWTVDSEANKDFLRFYIDGVFQSQISGPQAPSGGTPAWELRGYTLGTGDHTLRWIYSKDASATSGRDAAWVDTVSLETGNSLPVIISPLTATAYLGRPFKYQITATNGPTSFAANSLPEGLSIDQTTGVIRGTPQAIGMTAVTIAASNSGGRGTAASLMLGVVAEPPGADGFANATVLGGAAVSVVGTNAFATAEVGEPSHAGRPAKASLWYSWTAPLTGSVNITTRGSDIDTVLSVYQGSALDALTVLKENDDDGKLVSSAVKVDAKAGSTYLIAVDSLNGNSGQVVLNITYTATGVYSGLLEESNAERSPGLATISLTAKFMFTGSLQFGKEKLAVKGAFTGEDFAGDIARGKNLPPARLTLHIDLSPGAEEVTGQVAMDGRTYGLFAKLALSKADVPAEVIGAFTFIMEPDDTDTPGLPRGVGYGSAIVDKSGKVKATGVLADGAKFSSGTTLATDRSWLLYLTPYKAGGVCAGEVQVDAGAQFPPLSASMQWARSIDARAKLFVLGFNLTTATLKGYRYVKPAKDQRVLQLNESTHQLEFSFGESDLESALPVVAVTLETTNKLSGLPAGFKASIVASSGLFSGTTADAVGVTHSFGGALLQSSAVRQPAPLPALQDGGAGFYFGRSTTGSVRVTPRSP